MKDKQKIKSEILFWGLILLCIVFIVSSLLGNFFIGISLLIFIFFYGAFLNKYLIKNQKEKNK